MGSRSLSNKCHQCLPPNILNSQISYCRSCSFSKYTTSSTINSLNWWWTLPDRSKWLYPLSGIWCSNILTASHIWWVVHVWQGWRETRHLNEVITEEFEISIEARHYLILYWQESEQKLALCEHMIMHIHVVYDRPVGRHQRRACYASPLLHAELQGQCYRLYWDTNYGGQESDQKRRLYV